jgi:cell division protein FtsL
MVGLLGVVVAALVIASLVLLGLYALVCVAVAVSTLISAHGHRRLTEDLDEVLDEVLGPRTAGMKPPLSTSRAVLGD